MVVFRGTSTTRRWIRAAVLVAASVSATACLPRPRHASEYFPLDAGRTWTFAIVSDQMEGGDERGALQVTIMDAAEVGGTRVTRKRVERDDESEILLFGSDAKGIFRHAAGTEEEAEPAIDAEHQYVLPEPLTVGASWKSQTGPSFVDVMNFFGPIEIVSTVAALGETVRTGAGEFTDTVKIQVAGTAEVGDMTGEKVVGSLPAAGEEEGDWDLYRGTFTVEETKWFARGVGLVKSVLVERFVGDFEDERLEVTTELESFTR